MQKSIVVPHALNLVLRACVIAAFLACAAPAIQAQTPGALDLSFDSGSAVSGYVYAVAPAVDGKVYVGGGFTTVRGALRNRIARLNADGTADETFSPGTLAGGIDDRPDIYALAVQADGKVLIGGYFTRYNGTSRNHIARLNIDGSLDPSFDPGTGATGPSYPLIYSIAVQHDGQVLIGGYFTGYNGSPRNGVARLNSDGSLDSSFDSAIGASGTVFSIALQDDGKMLIGGSFMSYNGTARNRIARLNSDGSLDPSFDPGTGVGYDPTVPGGGTVNTVVVQADGKVIIGGFFNRYNGAARYYLARLNSDGSLDPSFIGSVSVFSSPDRPTVYSITLQADGKVLIGGTFDTVHGTQRNGIARLNSDGSLDLSFDAGTGANGTVYSIAVRDDGKLLIGGSFFSYNGTTRFSIARLNSDGILDLSFIPGTGANGGISSIAVQPDGKVFIAGNFTSYNGTARSRIARLNSDGSLDLSFDPGTGASGTVSSIIVQADEKVLIAGEFTSYNGAARNHLARLNRDGSLDSSFDPGTGPTSQYHPLIYSISVQADGKVLIGGWFTSYNGTMRNHIARINSDGSLDTSFNPGGTDQAVVSIALQPDGKVLIGGSFTLYYGLGRNRIARLNSNGTLDLSFNPGTGVNSDVDSIALYADGKMLIGGNFTTCNGTARNRIARLNSNGSLDSSFNPGTGLANPSGYSPTIYSTTVQADGKVLIGGIFTSYNGMVRNFLARLNSDGSLDPGFNVGAGANNAVSSIAVQADGKVLIGGGFSSYDGTARFCLARVANDPSTQSLSVPNASEVRWLRGGAAPEVEQVNFEDSADGVSWSALGAGTRISGGWELTNLNLNGTGYIRARGRATGGIHNASSSMIEQVFAFSDADSDGLLDSWELAYWPTTNGHKASDDFDGDGMLELLELAFGLNPTVADAALQPLVVEEGGYLTLTISKHAGVTYEVQTAGTLLSGQPGSFSAASTATLINNASTLKVRDSYPIAAASARRFLRVKVSAAP